MAGDIFFTDQLVWLSSSNCFCNVIERAIRKYRGNNELVVQKLSNALECRCLGINLEPDSGLKIVLTELVLESAREEQLEDLAIAAQEHLRNLSGGSGRP